MQRLEVSGAVRPIYGSLGVKRLKVESRTLSHDNGDCFFFLTPLEREVDRLSIAGIGRKFQHRGADTLTHIAVARSICTRHTWCQLNCAGRFAV